MTEKPIKPKKYKPYLQFGLGVAHRYGVPERAVLLDRAAYAKLPVPTGIILLDDAYQTTLREGLIVQDESGRIRVPDIEPFLGRLNLPNFRWELTGPFTITDAFTVDPNADGKNTNVVVTPHINVDALDQEAFVKVLCEMWAVPGVTRRDLMIMRTVNAQVGGTAETGSIPGEDVVQISSDDHGNNYEVIALPRIGGFQRPDPNRPAYQQRLQTLLRNVRRTFVTRKTAKTHPKWSVQWMDDGAVCWIVGLEYTGEPRGE
jgi:hypothetical protein